MPATTTTWNKTAGANVLSLQSVASNTVVISSAIDVSSVFSAFFGIHFGRRAATALTLGAIFRIEASAAASGDGYWFPVAIFQSVVTAAPDEAVSGTCAAGQNVIAMASTTGFTVGMIVFIDNGTITNSEWGRIKSISSNVSVTLEDNLLNAQTGSTVYGLGEFYQATVDLSAIKRVRVVDDSSGTGQNTACQVTMNTGDSLSTT